MSLQPNSLRAFDEFRKRAREHEREGRLDAAWACFEAAHILGQRHTGRHVLVHVEMLGFACRSKDWRESAGQLLRIVAAAVGTWIWVPKGNTGRSNVGSLRQMPIPDDLKQYVGGDESVTLQKPGA